jgi:hypothetical protein
MMHPSPGALALSSVFRLRSSVAVLFALALSSPLQAQQPLFNPTLFWDAGLVNTPAAYVSPLPADFSLNFTRLSLDDSKSTSFGKSAGYDFDVSVSAWSRADIGISLFGSSLKAGLFAKVLAWDQRDGIWRTGWRHWMPSIAFGVRNLGTETTLNRFGQENFSGVKTAPSFYGVATRTLVLKAGDEGARPAIQLGVSAGVGSGLFSNDGGLGYAYSNSKTGGIFGGAQLQFATGRYSSLSLVAEHDGWDINAGAQLEVRGLRASVYLMELDAGQGKTGSASFQKVAFSLGWQTNLLTLVRGNQMEARTLEYERAADALKQQIQAGEARVQALEAQLRSLQATTASGQSTAIDDLRRQLQEERDAVARLQELLKQRAAVKKP